MVRAHFRKLVQLAVAALYNANFMGFKTGALYRGDLKRFCAPGLNCYSCPGAVAACPLGALQMAINKFPGAPFVYVLGFLILAGALLGRAICGFLCPFGLIQELFHKIPTPKIQKSRVTRNLTYLKYIVLALFVFALPHILGSPAFCRWICPAGTLEGALPALITNPTLFQMAGWAFILKVTLLVAAVVLSVFMFRPFCRFICPLGAIYSFFNKIAVFGVKLDKAKCVSCGSCARHCKMDVKIVNDRECIRCGECAKTCPTGAIKISIGGKQNVKKVNGTCDGAGTDDGRGIRGDAGDNAG